MKPSYWTVHLAVRGKIYVHEDDLPACLRPDGVFPKDAPLIWLKDHGGGLIGFPPCEIVSIEWMDDQVRLKDAEFRLLVNGEPKEDEDLEPWQR